jgi:hypothetical protein
MRTEYAHPGAGCNEIALRKLIVSGGRIARKMDGEAANGSLCNGVMVSPRGFEPMGEVLNRDGTAGAPDDESDGGSTESSSYIKNIFHEAPNEIVLFRLGCAEVAFAFDGRAGVFSGEGGTATLNGMDSVRFGRALGVGARAAAKSLVTAVDAATTPNPRPVEKPSVPAAQLATSRPTTARAASQQVTRTAAQAKRATEGVARGGKRFGEAVWSPFVRLSGVLWLEFTGVFFGIFAVYALSGAWKLRGHLHEKAGEHDAHVHFLMAAIMGIVFAYFCISSFSRAKRRERAR